MHALGFTRRRLKWKKTGTCKNTTGSDVGKRLEAYVKKTADAGKEKTGESHLSVDVSADKSLIGETRMSDSTLFA